MNAIEVECPGTGCDGKIRTSSAGVGRAFGAQASWEIAEAQCSKCGTPYEVHLRQAVDLVRKTGGKTELVRRVVLGDQE